MDYPVRTTRYLVPGTGFLRRRRDEEISAMTFGFGGRITAAARMNHRIKETQNHNGYSKVSDFLRYLPVWYGTDATQDFEKPF